MVKTGIFQANYICINDAMMIHTFHFNSKSSLLSFLLGYRKSFHLKKNPGCVDAGTNFDNRNRKTCGLN